MTHVAYRQLCSALQEAAQFLHTFTKGKQAFLLTTVLAASLSLASCMPSSKGRTPSASESGDGNIRTESHLNDQKAPAEATEAKGDIEGPEIPAQLTDRKETILRRTGYTVSYNEDLLIPNWVAWHLTSDRLTGPAKRKGISFMEDTEAPGVLVNTHDYARSGFDRGHMCPAGDNKWSQQAMRESFLLTNICPQAPSLNRGDWNEMEIQCRKWAETYGDIYIVAGPILYRGHHKQIGTHRVTVPEAFFKVVLCMQGRTEGHRLHLQERGRQPPERRLCQHRRRGGAHHGHRLLPLAARRDRTARGGQGQPRRVALTHPTRQNRTFFKKQAILPCFIPNLFRTFAPR